MNACIVLIANWLCAGCIGGNCDLPLRPQARVALEQPSPREVTLSVGKPVAIAAESLSIELVAVRDSRCAVEVKCVWAGAAELELRVRKPATASQTVVLGGEPPAPGANADGRLDRYRLALIRLEPPNSIARPVAQHAYRATIEVVKE